MGEWVDVNILDASEQFKKEKQKIKPTMSYPKLGRVKPSLSLGFWIGSWL